MFESVDWSLRGPHMERRHGVSVAEADDALCDSNRVVISPDYNSVSGRSSRVIGYSRITGSIVTVIVLRDGGIDYGVNGWLANAKDRRIYLEGGRHEQA